MFVRSNSGLSILRIQPTDAENKDQRQTTHATRLDDFEDLCQLA